MSRAARLAAALSLAAHALLFLLPGPGGEAGRPLQVRLIAGERRQVRDEVPPRAASLAARVSPAAAAAPRGAVPAASSPGAAVRDTSVPALVQAIPGKTEEAQPEGSVPGQGADDAARAVAPPGDAATAGEPPRPDRDAAVAASGGMQREAGVADARPGGGDGVAESARGGTDDVPAAASPPVVDVLPLIRQRILAAREYPALARTRGWVGTNRVRFRVGEGGRPEGVELLESSGIRLLDQCSVRAVEAAAPYPLYEGWIVVPIAYELRG